LSNQHVTIAKNPATGTGEPETIVNPAELTYNNLLLSLNSDIAFEADLADDPAVKYLTSGLQLISKSIGFVNQTGHFDLDTNNDGINDAISVNHVCENSFTSGRVKEISDCVTGVVTGFTAMIDNDNIPSGLLSSLSAEIGILTGFNTDLKFNFPSSVVSGDVAVTGSLSLDSLKDVFDKVPSSLSVTGYLDSYLIQEINPDASLVEPVSRKIYI
jgi:hypothetical protein